MTVLDAAADKALKDRHRAMWESGDFPTLARDVVSGLGPALVAASGIGPGDKVLDVGAGSGNASIPAALTGATVVASDLAPRLLAAGRAAAAAQGVQLEWREADAEALPFADGEFDAAISCVGVMFAPHHEVAAAELARVVRPGGTITLLSWTPAGFIGQMFATMKPYAPPLPPGARPAPLWGDPEHVAGLLAGRAEVVSAWRESLRVTAFARPEEFRDCFKALYGPTIAVYRALQETPGQAAALDADLVDLARRHGLGVRGPVVEWEYLLLTARVLPAAG